MHVGRTLLSFALVASMGLAACGGDNDEGSGLSRSKLVAKADAICTKSAAAAKAVPVPASLEDANLAAAYFGKIAPITRKATDDLAALEPADEVKPDWDALVEKLDASADLLQTISRKARAKDPSGQEDLKRADATSQAVTDASNKVGSKVCAK